MKPIDFDRHFKLYALAYIRNHPGLTEDEIEDKYNEMYSAWLAEPADWLEGVSPGEYFQRFSDAGELIELMRTYAASGLEIPEILYARLRELSGSAESPLLTLFEDASAPVDARATALSLLMEAGSIAAAEACCAYTAELDAPDELSEAACRYVESCGVAARRALMAYAHAAASAGLEMLLDIMTKLPFEEEVYELVCREFQNRPDKKAFYASLLARLNDPRAIPILERAASSTDLNYLDYMEIENAIEMLGGDIDPSREFYGDQDFEAMRKYE